MLDVFDNGRIVKVVNVVMAGRGIMVMKASIVRVVH